uniref:hypothetical protein n=1 Tax=Pseudomonas sp. TaxID=306 RepID=UPI0026353F97
MSDPASIDDRLEAAAVKAEGGSEILRRFANDPAGTYISTESGPLPSIAEWLLLQAAAIGSLPTRTTALEQFVADLQDPTEPAKGVALLPYAGGTLKQFLDNLAATRLVSVADFGIVPDGVTNWESAGGAAWSDMLAASLTTGVYWPPGYYATAINFNSDLSGSRMHFAPGAILGGVVHLISDPSPTRSTISSISRAANVVLVATSGDHGYTTGQRVQIRHVYATGAGSVDFNGDDFSITVTGTDTFTFAQVGPDASGTVSSNSSVNQRPVKDVRITGWLTTTDRFGTINCKDCFVENVWVMNDPSRHSAYPGLPCRGAHLYIGTDGLVMKNLIVDYASGANTDAALAMDGNAWNPSNCSFDFVHIKDSGYHGAYISGFGHRFGELRVDAFAKEVAPGRAIQDSDGIAQSDQLKGVWLNRCWDTDIGVLRTSQNVADGSRGYARFQALIDETGHAFYSARDHRVTIGRWYAENVRGYGIAIGDPSYNSVVCNVQIGLLQIKPAPSGVVAGEYLLRVNGGASGGSAVIDHLSFVDSLANKNLYVETTGVLSAQYLESKNHVGQVLNARGRVNIGEIVLSGTAATTQADPIIQLQNAASAGSRLGDIRAIGS